MARFGMLLVPLVLLAPLVPADVPPLPAPEASPCASVPSGERNATAGSGDLAIPTLVWAAVKTGFRVGIAWETLEPLPGEVVFSVEGGDPQRSIGLPASPQQVLILDNLPVGGVLCFQARAGPFWSAWHAVRLANAYTWPPATSAGNYAVNLLVLATEADKDQDTIEASLPVFAEKLWDATDGHVRAGTIILVVGDPQRVQPGWHTCRIRPPPDTHGFQTTEWCDRTNLTSGAYDVVYTHGIEGANGMAMFDSISDPRHAIWMWANGTLPGEGRPGWTPQEAGFVLVHEFGHYAFGAQDARNGLSRCYDATTGVSIMGSDRNSTELDDDVSPCPAGTTPAGYSDSWDHMQEKFTMVPDRTGAPDAGPTGTGGALSVHSFRYLPERP